MQSLPYLQTQSVAFQYPARLRRIVAALWGVVLLFNGVEFVLAWRRVLYSCIWGPLGLPATPPIALLAPPPARLVIPMLLTANIGLAVALISARAIAFLTPRITLRSNGLLI